VKTPAAKAYHGGRLATNSTATVQRGKEPMQRLTGKFQATGSNGQTYTVEVWTHFLNAAEAEDPHAEGVKSLRTAHGHKLNRLNQGEYEIPGTGVILKSADPNAP
jgi:hypothetical protein